MLTLVRTSMWTKREKKKEKKKGFTLVELVIVVAIIAIIAVIAVPQFTTMTANAKASTMETNHNVLVSAVNQYIAANGSAPTALDDLNDYIAGTAADTGKFGNGIEVSSFKDKPAKSTYKIACVEGADKGDPVTITITSTLADVPTQFAEKVADRLGEMKDDGTTYECTTIIKV